MSVAKVDDNRKVTTHRLIEMKQRGEKIDRSSRNGCDLGGRLRF